MNSTNLDEIKITSLTSKLESLGKKNINIEINESLNLYEECIKQNLKDEGKIIYRINKQFL